MDYWLRSVDLEVERERAKALSAFLRLRALTREIEPVRIPYETPRIPWREVPEVRLDVAF